MRTMKIAPPIDEETYKRMKVLAAIHGVKLNELVPLLLNHAMDLLDTEERIESLIQRMKEESK